MDYTKKELEHVHGMKFPKLKDKSTPRSKVLKKKLVGKEGYKPSKFIDHYE